MKLSLSDVRDNENIRYEYFLPSETIFFQGELFEPIEPIKVQLSFRRADNSIEVVGEISGSWFVACARCLEMTKVSLHLDVDELWPMSGDQEHSEDFYNSLFVDRDKLTVDLSDYALAHVTESLPMRSLCSADCRGLCNVCGSNLNKVACGCQSREIDPRLAILGRLLNDKGGVKDGIAKKKNVKVSPR